MQLGVMLLVGTLVRLTLIPLTGGFGYDVETFQNWALTLNNHSTRSFYDRAEAPDHLPGDLWVMKALVEVFTAFGGENFKGRTFEWCLKVVPLFGDVAVAIAIAAIVSRLMAKPDGLRAASWYFLNPASIFVTAIWGQWDSISLAILLIGFLLILRGDPAWILASMPIVWAVLIKPQLAIPAVALISVLLFREWDSGDWRTIRIRTFLGKGMVSIGLGIAFALLILVPFSVGLPGMSTRWSLVDRLREALDLYPHTTLGAANVWMIPIGSLERITDESPKWLGLSPNAWGSAGLVLALLYIAATTIRAFDRNRRAEAACWAAGASIFAIFMVPTRVHERYLFPIIAFALLYLAVNGFRRLPVRLYWGVSVVFTLNLLLVFGGFREAMPSSLRWISEDFGFISLSIINVALFIIFLALPWLPGASPASARDAPTEDSNEATVLQPVA